MVALFRRRQTRDAPSVVETEGGAVLVAPVEADRQAFAELYRAYFVAIYRYCYARLGSQERAEDAAHQVFVRALEAFGRYEETGRARQWLFTVAHNVVTNELAARRPVADLDAAGEAADPRPSPETLALDSADRRALREAIERLPGDQRRAIELRIAGLTGREIAAELGRSHEAAKMLQQRAIDRLRTELGAACRGGGRGGA